MGSGDFVTVARWPIPQRAPERDMSEADSAEDEVRNPFTDAVAGDQLKIESESESGRGDPPIGFVDLVSQSVAGPTGPSSKLGAGPPALG